MSPLPLKKAVPGKVVLAAFALAALLLAAPAAADTPPGPAAGAQASVFSPAPSLGLSDLESVIRDRSAAYSIAALDVDLARSEVRQSELLLNPGVDASWGTIPIGQTNPANLHDRFANVPNYGLGVSYTFLIGKRGPRQQRARAIERGARAGLAATVREQALELARVLGAAATATLRIEGVRGLVEQGKHSVTLAEARLAASFATPLDVDRVRIDLARSEQQFASAQSDLNGALAACASVVGTPCREFASDQDARAFLTQWIDRTPSGRNLSDRPDLQAIDAYRKAADHETELARAQAIPDPTVRLGYVHDRFVISGNQQNSLTLTVGLPLPVFDRGQAQVAAAQARSSRLAEHRSRLMQAAHARIAELTQRVARQRERQRVLASDVIPRAQAVLRDVDAASEARLLPVADVILARRTVSELLVEEADSYGDAFDAAVALAAELPSASDSPVPVAGSTGDAKDSSP